MSASVHFFEAKSLTLISSVSQVCDSKKLKHCYVHFLSSPSITIIFRPTQQRPTLDISAIPLQGVDKWQQEGKGNGSVGRKRVATLLNEKVLLGLVCFQKLHFSGSLCCLFILTHWKNQKWFALYKTNHRVSDVKLR